MENVGVVLLAVAALSLVRYKSDMSTPIPQPSVENEVDVTRWRHDGTQPITHTAGNGLTVEDPHASSLYERLFG